MTPPYKLTKEADADLEDIARYTLKKWRERQAVEYLDAIEKCLCSLADSKLLKPALLKQYPKLQIRRCEHHYVFYLHREGTCPIVVAVLHERMDMLSRLKSRLG